MKNYGLIEDLQELGAYIFGKSPMPCVPYQEDGDWRPYLPVFEHQAPNFETSGCTSFGALSQIEIFMKRLYKEEPNYSERFIYLLAGIKPGKGVDPQVTFEAIRKNGLVPQKLMPMEDTVEAFMDTSDLTDSVRAQGQNWLYIHDFQHEWLWQSAANRPEDWKARLKGALTSSPIGVSVSAWQKEGDVYVSRGNVNNHFCVLVHIDDEGYMYVYDSYLPQLKKLAPDHNIRRAKRIWVNRKTRPSMRKHISLLQAIINTLMNKKSLVEVCTSYLGTDPSPKDTAPDSLACVDTATTILGMVYPEVPHMVSTIKLAEWFKASKTFIPVSLPTPGTIILSPTVGSRIGHVGFVMEDGTIASNDSGIFVPMNKGKFMKNYTVNTWHKYYKEKQKLDILMYKHV